MNTHHHLFLVIIELIVAVALVECNTRVEHVGVLLVLDKEHLAMQVHQTILDILLVFSEITALLGHQRIEILLHLHLRIKLRLEPVDIVVVGVEEGLYGLIGINAKHIAEEIAADIRLGEAVTVSLDSHVPQVLHGIRHSGIEVPAQSPNSRLGHLPDTEEAQDMVDAVGVEIVLHLGETAAPPEEIILGHLVPVVGGEAPVLATCIEIIGRSTGRSVQVK